MADLSQPQESIKDNAVGINREVAAKMHDDYLRAIQESEERYRSLVIATSQIVWTTDAAGQVEDMPSWRVYTGQSQSQVKGWGWLQALHPEDRERTAQIWSQAVQNKSLYQTEYRIQAADGSYRYFSARGVPVLTSAGEIREWVGTCTDISQRKASEAALRERAEELTYLTAVLSRTNLALEKRNQELDQFAYVASHDLKAPLRAIANLSQWIEEDLKEQLTPETQHHMDLLRGRVQRLEGLINGLLAFSRVGRTQAAVTTVSINTLLEDVIDSLSPPETFTIEIQPELPTILTQRLPLEQVFANLISNAIKHHPRIDGRIKISCKIVGKFYQFAVADDGAGIAPEYHQKVFEIFQTLQARDRSENTGIGLAIVRKIVESQGGTIWLESQADKGAIFHFTWPKQPTK